MDVKFCKMRARDLYDVYEAYLEPFHRMETDILRVIEEKEL